MAHNGLDRRAFLKVAAASGTVIAGTGSLAFGAKGRKKDPAATSNGASEPFRIAHLTDFHIQPERRGREGVESCLGHVRALPKAPGLVITGGDLVMDAFDQGPEKTKQLFDLFKGVMKDGCAIPVEHTMGNHDIWGWNKKLSKTTGEEVGWGKKYFQDALGVESLHRVIDRGGWRIFILDSVQPGDGTFGYIGGLDDTQFEWLKAELEKTPKNMPVMCVSHIPILGIGPMMMDGRIGERGITIEKPVMFTDAFRVVDLFSKYPNVKLCVSGHIHVVERLDFKGVTYWCGGAVSGAWWWTPEADRDRRAKNASAQGAQGAVQNPRPTRAPNGYSTIDLWADGRFGIEYQNYGWKGQELS